MRSMELNTDNISNIDSLVGKQHQEEDEEHDVISSPRAASPTSPLSPLSSSRRKSTIKKRMSFAGITKKPRFIRRSSTKNTEFSDIGSGGSGSGSGSGDEGGYSSPPPPPNTCALSPTSSIKNSIKRRLRKRNSAPATSSLEREAEIAVNRNDIEEDTRRGGGGGGSNGRSSNDRRSGDAVEFRHSGSTIQTAILTSYSEKVTKRKNNMNNNNNIVEKPTITASSSSSSDDSNKRNNNNDNNSSKQQQQQITQVSNEIIKPTGFMCGAGGGKNLFQNLIVCGHNRKYNPILSDDDDDELTMKRIHQSSVDQKGNIVIENVDDDDDDDDLLSHLLPHDPTIQESIECIFAHQKDGIFSDDENDSSDDDDDDEIGLNSYKIFQVGRFDPSIDVRDPPVIRESTTAATSSSLIDSVYKTLTSWDEEEEEDVTTPTPTTPGKCRCQRGLRSPAIKPDLWPQRPLMLRPTAGCGMHVRGIRFASASAEDDNYLWKPQPSSNNNSDGSGGGGNSSEGGGAFWPQKLHEHWNKNSNNSNTWRECNNMCSECMLLPINNGNEQPGESLVIDFTSNLFVGTLLVRVRNSNGTTQQPYDDTVGYFAGMNRRYQVIIQGKFRKPLSLTKCVTGHVLERPCGKLPPHWIVKGGEKVIKFFAPQLETHLDASHPSTLSPLGSTPQVIKVQQKKKKNTISSPEEDDQDSYNNKDYCDYNADVSIEKMQEEPSIADETLLNMASNASESLTRARFRKKAFDKLYVSQSNEPIVGPTSTKTAEVVVDDEEYCEEDKIYTFEFLQHMINFNEFAVELGSFLGSLPLQPTLDGQPLQIMASYDDNHHNNNNDSNDNDENNNTNKKTKNKKKKNSRSKKCNIHHDNNNSNSKQILWSFDIWHESLYDDAVKHDNDLMN